MAEILLRELDAILDMLLCQRGLQFLIIDTRGLRGDHVINSEPMF